MGIRKTKRFLSNTFLNKLTNSRKHILWVFLATRTGGWTKYLKTLTCEFDMELIFRFEYLDVERTVGGKVLDRPGSQDGLVVLAGSTRANLISFLNFCRKKKSTWINIIWLMTCLPVHTWTTAHRWLWIIYELSSLRSCLPLPCGPPRCGCSGWNKPLRHPFCHSAAKQQQQRYGHQGHNNSCMETRYNIDQMQMDRWTVLECTVYALWWCARIALALTGECKNAK